MQTESPPYIRISMIGGYLDRNYVLDQLMRKFKQVLKARAVRVNKPYPSVTVYFPSKEEMILKYNHDIPFFEAALDLIRNHASPASLLGFKEFFDLKKKKGIHFLKQFSDKIDPKYQPYFDELWKIASDEDVELSKDVLNNYLENLPSNAVVLKYQTNFKEFLRTHYTFTFKIAQLVDLKYEFEEIEDGFILFHKTIFDFDFSLVNLMKMKEVLKLLKRYGIENDNPLALFIKDVYKELSINKKINTIY